MTPTPLPNHPANPIQRERHFGDRDILCFRDRPKNVLALLVGAVARNPNGEAIVAGDRRIGYRELGDLVDRAARGLLADGIGAGDRVAILLDNRPEFVIALLAAIRLGAIAVPINVREQTDELAFILNDCGAIALVHEAALAERLPVPNRVPAVVRRYVVGGEGDFDDLPTHRGLALPPLAADEEATAILLYTSGTTGHPKGAMLTHMNIAHSAMHYQTCFDLAAKDRSMLVVPASHVTGIVAIILSMIRAGGAVIMMRSFDAPAFLELAARERMTHTVMVPAMYNLCLLRADFAAHDLSSWRIGAYGGASMPEATIASLANHLPDLSLANAYGATETTSPTTIMPLGGTAARADSVGQVVPCGEIKILDDDGVQLAPGEVGEICIKGPMVVPGYWNKPEATAENFVDGYWHSGDLGSVDADGYVMVLDRKKDLINRGGYKIHSAEVENVLSYHPDVAEVAAVPKPDPVLGERVHCFVLGTGATVDPGDLKTFCAERMADYKVPESFTLIDQPLPRNANGKVMKRLLAERLREELA